MRRKKQQTHTNKLVYNRGKTHVPFLQCCRYPMTMQNGRDTDVQDILTCCLCSLNDICTPLSPATSALYRLCFKVQKVSKVCFPKGMKSQSRYYPALSDRDELWKQRPQEEPLPTVGMLAKPTLHQAWVEGPSSPPLCR